MHKNLPFFLVPGHVCGGVSPIFPKISPLFDLGHASVMCAKCAAARGVGGGEYMYKPIDSGYLMFDFINTRTIFSERMNEYIVGW